MNQQKVLPIETDGARVEIRPPHFASDARSQVGSTRQTSRNWPRRLNKLSGGLSKPAHCTTYKTVSEVRGRFAVGFFEAWRRRSIGRSKKNAPATRRPPGPGASSTRPRPGYPLLGCSPAEPNSVSPGNVNDKSRSACWLKIDRSAYRVGRFKIDTTALRLGADQFAQFRALQDGKSGTDGIIVTLTDPDLSSCRF
jgi:hypothetical protein